jgi:hypothetical protein
MDAGQKAVVETLLDKAATANNPVDAMNFAQAACNAANALRALAEASRSSKG